MVTQFQILDRASCLEGMANTKGWEYFCEDIDEEIMKRYLLAEHLAGQGRKDEVEAKLLEARGLKAVGKIFERKLMEANSIRELIRSEGQKV